MTITKEQLSEAELACLDVFESDEAESLPSYILPIWHIGKAIHEKLNAKKKVDYSVT